MVDLKRTVKYRWVPRDAENAQKPPPMAAPQDNGAKWSAYQARKLTPYGFVPEMLPGCEKYKVGAPVPINLGGSYLYRLEVNRFAELGGDVDWLPIDAEDLAGCATIGALCEKLLADGNGKLAAKYGGIYNAFKDKDEATEAARGKLAKAIFDHWDNTNLRYAVITSGKFDWSDFDKQPWQQPTQASVEETEGGTKKTVTYRILKVPTKVPRVKQVPAAQGTQVVVTPDAEMEALEGDMRRIREETRRIYTLLDQSHTYMKERMRFAHHLTMLRVLLEASSTGAGDLSKRAGELAQNAKALEETAAKAMKEEPLPQVLDPRVATVAPSKSVQAIIRRELGYVDDIEKAFTDAGKSLGALLFDDTSFADRVEKWGLYVIGKKLHETPAFQVQQVKISTTLTDAILALTETPLSDAHKGKIDTLLASVPDVGLNASNVTQALSTGLHKIMAIFGKMGVWTKEHDVLRRGAFAAQLAGNLWGNLAGPPSITVALVQRRQWRIFNEKITTLDTAATLETEMETFVQDTVGYLNKCGAPMKPKTQADFEAAMKGRDPLALRKIKRDVLDEYSGSLQSGFRAKTGALVLQLIVMAWAVSDYHSKHGDIHVVDLLHFDAGSLGFAASALQLGVSTADWAVTALGTEKAVTFITRISHVAEISKRLAVVSGALQKTGMVLGGVAAIIGAWSCAEAAWQAEKDHDTMAYRANLLGVAGNLTLAFACGCWLAGTPIPGLNIIGLALVSASAIILFIHDEEEKSKTALSRVGVQIIDKVQLNAFCDKVGLRGDFTAKLGEIRAACAEGHLPTARDLPAIVKALEDAGYRADDVRFLVEARSAPFFQANLPTKA
jgi:hypothetical protein